LPRLDDADTVPAVNLEAEGKVYPAVAFVVEPELVGAFRDIFGLPGGMPPTFLAVAEFVVMPTVIDDPELGMDFPRVLHGAQEYELIRPPREGETLWIGARLDSIKVRGGTTFLVIAMEVVDETGAAVTRTRSTMIERTES